ncbi:MAG TPA: FkbM family methyltransferase, partial [Tepidisphaeraceae bacterium]|nr:FkbM family methyltransferase [Tepidisphaeraceae bacterium]
MDPQLIYDVGMNNGDDTAYYLSKGYRVVAIEADPVLVEQATHRFASEIAAERVTILNVAVAPTDGTARFWTSPTMRIWNSFNREIATREGRQAVA